MRAMPAIVTEQHLLGGMTQETWDRDPKHLGFVLARYKVVAKLLEGKQSALEVGCGDGTGARIVRQHVPTVYGIDVDSASIREAERLSSYRWPVHFQHGDILLGGFAFGVGAVYCLDVFEHIHPDQEDVFLRNLSAQAGMCIIGTPSLESQAYASEGSKAGHINCVTKAGLRERMQRHWKHVFILGMNDETLHCGFDGMTHYLLGIGCN